VKDHVFEHFKTINPPDEIGMNNHGEIPSPPIRGIELLPPVLKKCHGILNAGTHPRGRKHEKELIIEVVVIRQCQDIALCCKIRYPIVRNIIGHAVSQVFIPGVD
jgi:hypothetical protein